MTASPLRRVRIQDPVPLDRSLHREIKDAYFAGRGIAAWTEGEIPCLATNSFPAARQHARFLLDWTDGRQGPVTVLEIGAGLGDFAANFLRALEAASDPRAAGLLARLRFVLSDYSERSVREAVAQPALARHVEAGRLLPALYDARKPDQLLDLDGEPIDVQADLLVANYVACVLDVKQLQRREEGWFELHVALDVELPAEDLEQAEGPSDGAVPAVEPSVDDPAALVRSLLADAHRPGLLDRLAAEYSWEPVELDAVFPDSIHPATLKRLAEGFPEASIPYPHGFLDFVRGCGPLLVDGGLLVVNDYGELDRASLAGRHRRAGVTYGNTTNLGVNFAVFDAFAGEAGLAVTRTREVLHSVHTALIARDSAAIVRATPMLTGRLEDREPAEDLVDFESAARKFTQAGEARHAVRMLRRCIELDPYEPDYRLRIGLLLLSLGESAGARSQLESGRALDGAERLGFDAPLGRACAALGDAEAAATHLQAAIDRAPDARLYTDLGNVYAGVDDMERAGFAYRHAVRLEPGVEPAASRLRAIQTAYLVAQLRARERAAGEPGAAE